MIWVLLTVVAVLLLGVLGALLTGRIGYDPLSEPTSTTPDPGLREGFTAGDVRAVRFDVAVRGYRMEQVDTVLELLARRLAEQEAELARLRGTEAGPAT